MLMCFSQKGGAIMRKRRPVYFLSILMILMVFSTSGCTIIFQKGRRVDVEKISKLKGELSELERAKRELEQRLKEEIDDSEVNIQMLQKGLVITFVAEVLFDSGKSDLRKSSKPKLAKVSKVLKTIVKDFPLGIEGHTDNVPIRHSKWKSNWELSSHRALSVLHYMIETHKIDPKRLSATGYGEQQPIASNNKKEGRQKNRRVEIVVLPITSQKGR